VPVLPSSSDERSVGEIISSVISLGVAVAAAYMANLYVLGGSGVWTVVGVSAVFGFLGAWTGERFGDAIVLTLFIGGITAAAFYYLPIPFFWQRIWLAAACGMCVGKLGASAYKETLRR
jgi:hypothetical protein